MKRIRPDNGTFWSFWRSVFLFTWATWKRIPSIRTSIGAHMNLVLTWTCGCVANFRLVVFVLVLVIIEYVLVKPVFFLISDILISGILISDNLISDLTVLVVIMINVFREIRTWKMRGFNTLIQIEVLVVSLLLLLLFLKNRVVRGVLRPWIPIRRIHRRLLKLVWLQCYEK